MIDFKNIQPGVNFALMRHDSHCPVIHSQQGGDCVCEPVLEFTNQAGFEASVAQNRKQRREAAKQAARAIKKAGKR